MIDESNKLNNEYEDLIEDMISDNTDNSSDQSDNTSEETHMNCDKNKNKDKNVKNTDAASVHNVMKDLVMAKSQKMKVMLKMTDRTVISAAAIEDTKISVKEMNILLNNICYVLKLEVNLMSMTRLNENDIYEMKRSVIYRDLIQTYNDAMTLKARISKSHRYYKNDSELISRDKNY
ncbi:hypothetical protein BDDG_12362 [Blastomyces dermatitidis ATCC 18188]|uniref:Uncharacterized protein n=1 Tax=Ajellomyces dermatitidis (strain ATCC 18188 / CBS 674.68) TaxID=653446 RepID=A0A0J9EP78_AJEDA|nr:hypothetical protein BDDG_12362 [Blastomyces dermatitidis ATCC 18188]